MPIVENLEYYKDKLEEVSCVTFGLMYRVTQLQLKERMESWASGEFGISETLMKVKVSSDGKENIKVRKLALGESETGDREIDIYENEYFNKDSRYKRYGKAMSKADIKMKGKDEFEIKVYNTIIVNYLFPKFDDIEALLVFGAQISNGKRYNCLMVPKFYVLIIFS